MTGWRLQHSYAGLPAAFHRRQAPQPVTAPRIALYNQALAERLGLDTTPDQSTAAAWFSGNRPPEGADPIAQAYAGHQFGHFTLLGDGRALLLGEQIAPDGARFDIQLKGSGRTPFSRRGDGRAALGPMLREYLISEAMHALGIPTTRSLAVVATGEAVYRERPLPGAVLTRVAGSHLRVGTFEYAAALDDIGHLRALADYTIARHEPRLEESDHPYLALLESVIERQARLIAQWMSVGFIHGVMNTDNMAICGETIDYGPCAFMDSYHPATVFSSIDEHGRYAYVNQPAIAQWNLARFAEALLPLLAESESQAIELAETCIRGFESRYRAHWLELMRAKLGLTSSREEDAALIEDLLQAMQEAQADFTNTFRTLSEGNDTSEAWQSAALRAWLPRWQQRVAQESGDIAKARAAMRNTNPAVIPRNLQVEAALEAATEHGDLSLTEQLLEVLRRPYETPADIRYCEAPGEAAKGYRTFCGT